MSLIQILIISTILISGDGLKFTKEILFTPSPDNLSEMFEECFSRHETLIPFGVSFLDRVFRGIEPQDFVVLAAGSGHGKTEIASYIASQAALNGKRVHMFALEADKNEIERRGIYRLAAQSYFSDPNRPKDLGINFEDFHYGTFDDRFLPYIDHAREEYIKRAKSFYTIYRNDSDFTVEHYENCMRIIDKGSDLIVLDHLNYFDTPGKNENLETTHIVKKLRDIVLKQKIPVILVVHVRKKNRHLDELVPSMEQIHGSSNIPKIATKIFTLSRVDDPENVNPRLIQTYIRPVKYRVSGGKTMFCGKVLYNIQTNTYEDKFVLGRLIKGGTEFQTISSSLEIPNWAQDDVKIKKTTPPKKCFYEPVTTEDVPF